MRNFAFCLASKPLRGILKMVSLKNYGASSRKRKMDLMVLGKVVKGMTK